MERANKTLKDRLIKEMRLRGISSIEEGNAFLDAFVVDYNRQFSVAPASCDDTHKILYHSPEQLKNVLSIHETRKLSKNLEFSHRNKIYQVVTKTMGYRLRHKEINLYTRLDGEIVVMADHKKLSYDVMEAKHRRYQADSKEINALVDAFIYAKTALPTGSTGTAQSAL